jgi:hypothetical protein
MKHLVLVFITCLISSVLLTAQKNTFSWGMMFTPKYSTALIGADAQAEADNRFGLDIQPLAGYQLGKRIEIVSGLLYSFQQLAVKDYSILFACDLRVDGFDYQNSWIENDIQLHYLGLPLQVKYHLTTGENRLFTRLGYNMLFVINESQTSTIFECNGKNELNGEVAHKINQSISELEIGIGADIHSGLHSALTLEAVVEYPLTATYDGRNILNDIRMLNIGLRLGVVFL